MNRFEFAQAILREDEIYVAKHKNIKLYHGDQKVCTFINLMSNIK